MQRINMKILLIVTTLLVAFPVQSFAALLVEYDGKQHQFAGGTRLSTVVGKFAEKPIYWPASQLFLLSDLNDKRQNLVNLIKTLSGNKELSNSLAKLEHQISSWELGVPIKSVINPATVRLKEENNPAFNGAQFKLILAKRPSQIFLLGAVEGKNHLPFVNMQPVHQYLKSVKLQRNADKDFVFVIQPNGITKQVGVAYWNKEHFVPMPGSQIFIPYQANILDFSGEISKLNDHILELAKYRVR